MASRSDTKVKRLLRAGNDEVYPARKGGRYRAIAVIELAGKAIL
jgi:hypothetical protein